MLDNIAKAHWLSASQIATYRLCPRKWGWNKLNGIKTPPNKYAEKGNRVHKVLASWLDEGTEIDLKTEEGKIASAGLKHLPPPGVGLVEQTFRFRTSIASYLGIWDLLIPTSPQVGEPAHTILPQVYDHKTTSDLKWMMHAEDLKKDVQSNLYAVAAAAVSMEFFKQFEIPPRAQLNWVYYRASEKRPGARKVQLYILPDGHAAPDRPKGVTQENFGVLYESDLAENFRSIEQTAQEILEHHRAKHKAPDLDINVTGCNAFGGCPYRGNPCKLTTSQVIRGHMDQKSLAEKMKKSREAQKTTETEESGEEQSLVDRMKNRAKPAAADASPEVVAEAKEEVAKAAEEVSGAKDTEEAPAINPGEEGVAEIAKEAHRQAAANEKAGIDPMDRVGGAAMIAQGITSARLYQHSDPRYADNVGALSLEIIDKIIELALK